jgi:hypothetical protein
MCTVQKQNKKRSYTIQLHHKEIKKIFPLTEDAKKSLTLQRGVTGSARIAKTLYVVE